MAPCISDKQGEKTTDSLKGFMRFLGAVARQFSIGMVLYKNSDQLHVCLFHCINN